MVCTPLTMIFDCDICRQFAIDAEFVTREGLSHLALMPSVAETFTYLEGEFEE